MSRIEYVPAAEEEFLAEIEYLEQRSRGLGRRFIGEVHRAEALIARFPEWAPEVAPGIRKYVLRTFQYSLLYSPRPDGVLILAVAHHKRQPNYWRNRATPGERR